MILHSEYLTDEELEQLISETEDDLVPAPPGIEEEITRAIFGADVSDKQAHKKHRNSIKKKRDFAAYCFRVAMSVAAAIAFVFIMPYLPDFAGDGGTLKMQEYTDKETFLKENGGQPRQEVYDEYPSREEVLNDKSVMRRLLDGENIFSGAEDAPGFLKEADVQEKVPATGNENNDRTNSKYEDGGQSL